MVRADAPSPAVSARRALRARLRRRWRAARTRRSGDARHDQRARHRRERPWWRDARQRPGRSERRMSFFLVAGDLDPDMPLQATMNRVAEPLTGALAIEMLWKKPDGTLTTVALTDVDLATGQVKRV